MHDPELYPDPFTFSPDRFAQVINNSEDGKSQPDPRTFAFGFGRRTCPGKRRSCNAMFLGLHICRRCSLRRNIHNVNYG